MRNLIAKLLASWRGVPTHEWEGGLLACWSLAYGKWFVGVVERPAGAYVAVGPLRESAGLPREASWALPSTSKLLVPPFLRGPAFSRLTLMFGDGRCLVVFG